MYSDAATSLFTLRHVCKEPALSLEMTRHFQERAKISYLLAYAHIAVYRHDAHTCRRRHFSPLCRRFIIFDALTLRWARFRWRCCHAAMTRYLPLTPHAAPRRHARHERGGARPDEGRLRAMPNTAYVYISLANSIPFLCHQRNTGCVTI